MHLIFSTRAKQDLKQIVAWITRKSGSATVANKFARNIRQKCQQLASHPFQMGSLRPELGAGSSPVQSAL